MSAPDIITIEGRAYSWRQILQLRRQQLEAWKAARPDQPALFELKRDCRPPADGTAAGRYCEPTLFSVLSRAGSSAVNEAPPDS